MKITAQLVNELRQRTGIGMMDCKKALQESDGKIEKAINLLRKKGYARAKNKINRTTMDGLVSSYIHTNSKLGVLVEVNCESDFVSRNEEFKELVKNIALHIAAADPKYISKDDIPLDVLEEEKDITRAQFEGSNKPQDIVEKIVLGKLGKLYSEVCLLNQPFIKDDKLTIEQLVASFIAKFGENVQIKRFARYVLGES